MNKLELAGIESNDAEVISKYAKSLAKQRGQSYESIIESIIIAISKKSLPILDNLGVHAPSLTQKNYNDFARSVAEVIKEKKLIK